MEVVHMLVLIELYDHREPINNVITLSAYHPEKLVVLGDSSVSKQRVQKYIDRYIAASDLQTETEYVPCRAYDLDQVEESLKGVIGRYGAENCVIDVIGGSEILLMAAGSCCREFSALRVVTQKKKTDEFVWLKGSPEVPVQEKLNITIQQAIALTGGELVRNARVSENTFDDAFVELIPKVFGVYMQYRNVWNEFVLYMQRLNQDEYRVDGCCTFCAPRVFYVGRRRVDPETEIFEALRDEGAITAFEETDDQYTVRFVSENVLKYLCDVGSWLELYSYVLLKKSCLFHEVQMSAVVSWDDDADKRDVINEIDLIALDGKGQMFISCKTALPDNMVLNEIAALTSHFGSMHAVPVLITASSLEKESPSVFKRAAEMGVAILDASDLREAKFMEELRKIRKRWTFE